VDCDHGESPEGSIGARGTEGRTDAGPKEAPSA